MISENIVHSHNHRKLQVMGFKFRSFCQVLGFWSRAKVQVFQVRWEACRISRISVSVKPRTDNISVISYSLILMSHHSNSTPYYCDILVTTAKESTSTKFQKWKVLQSRFFGSGDKNLIYLPILEIYRSLDMARHCGQPGLNGPQKGISYPDEVNQDPPPPAGRGSFMPFWGPFNPGWPRWLVEGSTKLIFWQWRQQYRIIIRCCCKIHS